MGDECGAAFVWQHEHGSKWILYNEKQQAVINKAFLKKQKTVTIPSNKPDTSILINFEHMYQKNKVSGWEQRIRCCVFEKSFYVWLWRDDDDNWNSYSASISFELEHSHQQNEDLNFFYKQDYVVIMKDLQQKNISTGTIRDVKREKVVIDMMDHIKEIAETFETAMLSYKEKIPQDDGDVVISAKRKKLDELKDIPKNFVNNVPVDAECMELYSKACVYQDETGPYDAMLNQTNLQRNNNKFYRIQLLQERVKKYYYVWFRWGRVGKMGQNKLIPYYTSLSTAIEEFTSRFFSKTKNEWSERNNFTTYPGKYELVKLDYEIKVVEPKDKKTPKKVPESQLHPKLKDLLKMISNIDEMEKKIIQMKFDVKKAPLGKLTQSQILAGYSALKDIENILRKNESGSKLLLACNDFYTKIPHDFGMKTPPIISTLSDIREKLQLLDALSDIKLTAEITIDQNIYNDNPIDHLYNMLDYKMEILDPDNRMVKILDDYLQDSHGFTHSHYKMEIIDVFKCENRKSDLHFKDYGNKYLLWHGSRLTNYVGILKNGLRIAPAEAPSTGYMFGKGIYFADVSSKSANYCYPTRLNNEGLLLLCEVSLGEQNELYSAYYNADSDMKRRKKNSVKGIGKYIHESGDALEISGVKIPLGKIGRNEACFDKCELNYNEYIVYDIRQVKICYLLHVKFLFE